MFLKLRYVVAFLLILTSTPGTSFAQTSTKEMIVIEDSVTDEREITEHMTEERDTTRGARKASVFTIVDSYGIYSFLPVAVKRWSTKHCLSVTLVSHMVPSSY